MDRWEQVSAAIDRPLSGREVEALIATAKAGKLDLEGQLLVGYSLEFYRTAAIKMEDCIHRMVKATEQRDALSENGQPRVPPLDRNTPPHGPGSSQHEPDMPPGA